MSATDAIILSFREPIREMVKDILKHKKVSNIVLSASSADAIGDLERFPSGMLVVDWEIGSLEVAKVLTANIGDGGINLRQVIILADEITTPLVTSSVEYGVTQIIHDLQNRTDMEAKIGGVIRSSSQRNDLRTELLQVAKYKGNGQFAEAEQVLHSLMQKHPQNLNLAAEMADCLVRQDKAKDAKELLEPIPNAVPPNLRYLHVYGRALMQLGEYAKALEVLERANVYNPHHADRLVDLGHVLMQGDRFKEASDAFDHALQVDPDSKDATMGKGQAMLLDGAINEALEILQGGVDDVELASVFNLSAVFCIRKSRFEQGMSLYRTALRALGGREKLMAKLYFNMGIGLCRQNDFGAARRQFELSVQHDGNFEKAKTNLRIVEQRLAQQALAISSGQAGSTASTPNKIDNEFDDFDSDDLSLGLEDSMGW